MAIYALKIRASSAVPALADTPSSMAFRRSSSSEQKPTGSAGLPAGCFYFWLCIRACDVAMERLRPELEGLGFRVERGKTSEGKIVVPVIFGCKGKILKCFNADAHAATADWVLEVEAGRALDNNQFLKEIFHACMMHDVLHLAIAVRNSYRGSDDFAKIENFLETLYVSGRLQLPLKGILLVGY